MVDAPISLVRLRDLARLGRLDRPRRTSSRPAVGDLMASPI
jgi:hypothetical protein